MEKARARKPENNVKTFIFYVPTVYICGCLSLTLPFNRNANENFPSYCTHIEATSAYKLNSQSAENYGTVWKKL